MRDRMSRTVPLAIAMLAASVVCGCAQSGGKARDPFAPRGSAPAAAGATTEQPTGELAAGKPAKAEAAPKKGAASAASGKASASSPTPS